VGAVVVAAAAQDSQPTLRDRLGALVVAGRLEDAVRAAQAALEASPADPAVRSEYIDLHLSIAHLWLREGRVYDAAGAAEAVLAVEPRNAAARRLADEVAGRLAEAARLEKQLPEDIRVERFDRALAAIERIRAARPDRAAIFAETERVALRGAADDHYFARNFAESFSLYERLRTVTTAPVAEVEQRWLLSLGLALSETVPPIQLDRMQAAAFAARVRAAGQDAPGWLCDGVEGLVHAAAGLDLEAGQALSRAAQRVWQLPPAESRARVLGELRAQVVERLRATYDATRSRDRGGAWDVAFENVWKSRTTTHFQVSARNDLVAQRVAAAAEQHLTEILESFGLVDALTRKISCALHVHDSLASLRAATGATGGTRAVTRTQVQGGAVLAQRIDLFQADVWLLGSTLPHELVHVVLAAACPDVALPRAIDEGVALSVEPFARRLQFLRTLALAGPAPDDLLTDAGPPADEVAFYAECLPLAEVFWARWTAHSEGGMLEFLGAWRPGPSSETWNALGWENADEWKARWLDRRRMLARTPRSPLVLSADASAP